MLLCCVCVSRHSLNPISLPVHSLRPGDIKVVASLGDSLTVSVLVNLCIGLCFIMLLVSFFLSVCIHQAGFGAKAKNILQLPDEERGVSWRSDVKLCLRNCFLILCNSYLLSF